MQYRTLAVAVALVLTNAMSIPHTVTSTVAVKNTCPSAGCSVADVQLERTALQKTYAYLLVGFAALDKIEVKASGSGEGRNSSMYTITIKYSGETTQTADSDRARLEGLPPNDLVNTFKKFMKEGGNNADDVEVELLPDVTIPEAALFEQKKEKEKKKKRDNKKKRLLRTGTIGSAVVGGVVATTTQVQINDYQKSVSRHPLDYPCYVVEGHTNGYAHEGEGEKTAVGVAQKRAEDVRWRLKQQYDPQTYPLNDRHDDPLDVVFSMAGLVPKTEAKSSAGSAGGAGGADSADSTDFAAENRRVEVKLSNPGTFRHILSHNERTGLPAVMFKDVKTGEERSGEEAVRGLVATANQGFEGGHVVSIDTADDCILSFQRIRFQPNETQLAGGADQAGDQQSVEQIKRIAEFMKAIDQLISDYNMQIKNNQDDNGFEVLDRYTITRISKSVKKGRSLSPGRLRDTIRTVSEEIKEIRTSHSFGSAGRDNNGNNGRKDPVSYDGTEVELEDTNVDNKGGKEGDEGEDQGRTKGKGERAVNAAESAAAMYEYGRASSAVLSHLDDGDALEAGLGVANDPDSCCSSCYNPTTWINCLKRRKKGSCLYRLGVRWGECFESYAAGPAYLKKKQRQWVWNLCRSIISGLIATGVGVAVTAILLECLPESTIDNLPTL